MKKSSAGGSTFQEFVDEHSPEEAVEIDRIWKKKLSEQKNRRYTIIMVCAVVIMISIFGLLMSYFDNTAANRHYQIQEITYLNTRYTYLQSNIPHLKFLVPFEDTKEIKTLRTLGIIYQEILAWIDSNVAPNSRVLYVPAEQSMVNVLGIALGYYLKGSLGGRLTIAVEGIKYAEMTEKNIELMNSGRAEAMPIEVVLLDELKLGQYELIVLENSNFHKSLPSTTNSTILIIRKESAETTIMNSIFLAHQKLEIIKGKTSTEIRELPAQYGYALIPYIPSAKRDNNYVLLVPDTTRDVELCEEANAELAQRPWVRSLVQRLKNESFTDSAILYTISSEAGLQIVATLPASKIYTTFPTVPAPANARVQSIKMASDFQRATRNILVVAAAAVPNFYLGAEDQIYVQITSEDERAKIEGKFKGLRLSVVSPYNNKGCFYPPALIEKTPQSPYFLLFRAQN